MLKVRFGEPHSRALQPRGEVERTRKCRLSLRKLDPGAHKAMPQVQPPHPEKRGLQPYDVYDRELRLPILLGLSGRLVAKNVWFLLVQPVPANDLQQQ